MKKKRPPTWDEIRKRARAFARRMEEREPQRKPRQRYDWSKVDLDRSAIEIARELGCTREAVYLARVRFLGRWTAKSNGNGRRSRVQR